MFRRGQHALLGSSWLTGLCGDKFVLESDVCPQQEAAQESMGVEFRPATLSVQNFVFISGRGAGRRWYALSECLQHLFARVPAPSVLAERSQC